MLTTCFYHSAQWDASINLCMDDCGGEQVALAIPKGVHHFHQERCMEEDQQYGHCLIFPQSCSEVVMKTESAASVKHFILFPLIAMPALIITLIASNMLIDVKLSHGDGTTSRPDPKLFWSFFGFRVNHLSNANHWGISGTFEQCPPPKPFFRGCVSGHYP